MSYYKAGIGASALLSAGQWQGWVWPVPIWQGRVPVVTDSFHENVEKGRTAPHYGVDIMFHRGVRDALTGGVVPSDGIHGTKGSVMPDGVPCIAPYVGKVWSADLSPRGFEMRIDHGTRNGVPINSYVQHLSMFARDWKKGDTVYPGTILGIVGGDTLPAAYHLKHCHFGLLLFDKRHRSVGGFNDYWVNPEPFMAWWKKIPMGGSGGPMVADSGDPTTHTGSGGISVATALGAAALAVGGTMVMHRLRGVYV